MASRTFRDPKCLEHALVIIAGSFAPAGTGAVTAPKGKGFTVARTGVGTFTVTLSDKWVSCLYAGAHVQLAASADTVAQVAAIDLTAKTVVIRTLTAGSDADIAADANNRVNFVLFLKNSSV